MIAVNGWCAVVMGGVGKWGDECSVNRGDSVHTFCKLFLKTATEGDLGAYSSFSQYSPKIPTLSFGGCSHLGEPCRGALLGRFEQEKGITSSDQYPKGPCIS